MIEGELIYLACPYSVGNPSKALMKYRARMATFVTGKLIQRGYVVFSPLTHNDPIEEMFDLPKYWTFWCQFDSAFLLRCTRVMVLMLPQWEESVGIKDEIRLAELHGIPVEYVELTDFDTVLFTKLRGELRTADSETLIGVPTTMRGENY